MVVCSLVSGRAIYLIFIKRRRPCVVLDPDGRAGVPVCVVLQESLRLGVSSHLHLVQLGLFPLVHGDGPHEAEVDAEAAVLAGALQADPDAVGHGHPLRVVRAALEATL